MKVTVPMTFEIDDDHPLVREAVEKAAAEVQPPDEYVEAPACCGQCDAPLPDERAAEGEMCEDCELEYVNPAEWARRHKVGK